MMIRCLLISAVLVMGLSGCVTSPSMIKTDTMNFNDVIEDTTNNLLLINVLRARDKAPLHFADIPIIRESLQESASLSAQTLFGAQHGNTQRINATLGLSAQISPSFEFSHLDAKDFVTGIASPIDAKYVKYWLDRGLDGRIVFLLFISSVQISEKA